MTDRDRARKREAHKRYYGKTACLYPMRRWTPEEVARVMEHSIPDSELSQELQRSLKSIQEKRRREKIRLAKSEE